MPDRAPPAAPDDRPLLLGRLRRRRCPDGTAYLSIRVWCPACEDTHEHSWNLKCGLTGVGHRTAHCAQTPDRLAGYWIALNPSYDEESRRLLKRFTGRSYP